MSAFIETSSGRLRSVATEGTVNELELKAKVNEILNRHPAVGLALGVVRNGHLAFFSGHGLADIATSAPVTEDTIFRIGSLTKTFTAIAVMQLWERGLIDLDSPANDYLRAYTLVPVRSSFRPATVQHLLTHTSGIPEVVHPADLFHFGWGPFGERPAQYSVNIGEPLPSLADYYHGGLRVVVDPGSAFAYSNHGYATLGQIVEDVSGESLDRYFREHIFEPLGMLDTDLVRSERVKARLATGYVLGPSGARAISDRDWIGGGSGGIYSSTRDMARYLAALLGGGAKEDGRILQPATLANMFAPQYQPDPRLTGMGLGFFRHETGGHLVISHEGILPGFNSALVAAPDDNLGLIAFTNGSSGAMAWLPLELGRLLRHLIGVKEEVVRDDIPQHPDIWDEICGQYQFPPRISDLRGRMMMGGGVQVFVRGGQLMLRALAPIPGLFGGLPLHPDNEHDPYMFRLDLSQLGMGTVRLVFAHDAAGGVTAIYTDLGSQPLSLYKQTIRTNRRVWAAGTLGAVAAGSALAAVRRSRRRQRRQEVAHGRQA